jgi:16S rRNA (guanine527-N7)-methyltransferase
MLLDATMKKVQFLHKAVEHLGVDNLIVLHARAEDVARSPDYRGVYDLATSRAVAKLPTLLEYSAPFVRIGGLIVAMKGKLAAEELSAGATAAAELGLQLREVVEVEFIPQVPHKERRLVVFEKRYATPPKYPRRVGLAKQRPIGGGAV